MTKITKGPKRVVRKRPLSSSFKPRPSREIDDRPYMKPKRDDDRPPRGRPPRDDDRPRPRREYDDSRPKPRRDYDAPPRSRSRDDDRPRPPRRDYDSPPRSRDRDSDRPRPPRRDSDAPRGRSGGFGDKKWGDRPSRPPREDRGPSDNRVLMDTVKRIESGMMEIMDRLARLEKALKDMG
jgi:hypothetical protein